MGQLSTEEMIMRKVKRSFVALFVMVFTVGFWLTPMAAEAVPSFAKSTESECTLCHVGYPKLNEFGQHFRANGYRMEGDEGEYIWDKPIAISIVTSASYQNTTMEMEADEDMDMDADEEDHLSTAAEDDEMDMEEDADHDEDSSITETKTAKFVADSLLVYSAGTLAPKVSYFTHFLVSEDGASLAVAAVTLMDLAGPDGTLNLRIGEMAVDLPFLSSSRRMTYADYLGQISAGAGAHAHSGGSSTGGVSWSNLGVELNGIVGAGDGHFEYALGTGNDSVEDSENNVGGAYYGYASYSLGGQSLGLIYKFDQGGEDEDDIDESTGIGVAAEATFGPLFLTLGYFQYQLAHADGDETNVTSYLAEVGFEIMPGLFGIARYDFNEDDDTGEGYAQIVGSFIYYIQPNVKLQAEYSQSIQTHEDGEELATDTFLALVGFGF